MPREARVVLPLVLAALASAAFSASAQREAPADGARPSPEAYIARWVRHRPRYRERHAHARWDTLPGSAWAVRPEQECLDMLPALGVTARRLPWAPTPAPAPVIVDGPVGGVTFHKRALDADFVVACELAARLPAFAAFLRTQGIDRVEVLSAYRRDPVDSFHHVGLAIDVSRLWAGETELSVERDFVVDRRRATCEGPPPEGHASRRLHALACALYEARLWSSVLTPNYDAGHRDHFHLDVRPDDPRTFLR